MNFFQRQRQRDDDLPAAPEDDTVETLDECDEDAEVEAKPARTWELRTYEVTWSTKDIEHVVANRIAYPDDSPFSSAVHHIQFWGDEEDLYRVFLSAQPGQILKIRDLGVVDEPEVPGQVEPEPAVSDRVRLADLADRVDAGETIHVVHPDWNDGKPVQIRTVALYGDDIGDGEIGVRYSFVDDDGDDRYRVEYVSVAALVTPYGGAG